MEVGDGRAIEAGEGLFRRGEVDLETNWAEEVTMLLEQTVGAESPESGDGEGYQGFFLFPAACAFT